MQHALPAHGAIEWPSWVPRVALLLPLATVIAALWQRDSLWLPDSATAWGAVAVAPWVFQAVTLRALPRWLFAGVALTGALGLLIAPSEIDMTAFLLVFLAAEVAATSRLLTGIAVALGAEGVMVFVEVFDTYQDSFPWLVGIAFGWAGGAAIGLQFKLLGESRAAAQASAERAAAEERQRIAREVHDVVAHSLSAVMLHLTGVRRELETGGDTAQAADALREAESVGRAALAEIRRTVGLLGPDSPSGSQPLPGASDIAVLAEQLGAAGLDLRWSVSGDPAEVAPTVGLAVYRVAQEALANAAKHAPGQPVEMYLDVRGDDLSLRVANRTNGASPNGDGTGMGLRGMADRVAVLGGDFSAGPRDDGWVVELRVPRTPVESA